MAPETGSRGVWKPHLPTGGGGAGPLGKGQLSEYVSTIAYTVYIYIYKYKIW